MSDATSNPSGQPTPTERFYVCRLLAPRPTFVTDMTPEESQAMEAHAAYWSEHLSLCLDPSRIRKGLGGSV